MSRPPCKGMIGTWGRTLLVRLRCAASHCIVVPRCLYQRHQPLAERNASLLATSKASKRTSLQAAAYLLRICHIMTFRRSGCTDAPMIVSRCPYHRWDVFERGRGIVRRVDDVSRYAKAHETQRRAFRTLCSFGLANFSLNEGGKTCALPSRVMELRGNAETETRRRQFMERTSMDRFG
jgi:hypothetical protein